MRGSLRQSPSARSHAVKRGADARPSPSRGGDAVAARRLHPCGESMSGHLRHAQDRAGRARADSERRLASRSSRSSAFAALATDRPRAAASRPFKDDLFAYPATLSSDDDGAYRVVDYREQRDIDERDEVPERRVKRAYVSLGVRGVQKDLKLRTAAGEVRHLRGRQDRRRVDHHRSTCTGRAAAASKASTTSPSAAISTASRT